MHALCTAMAVAHASSPFITTHSSRMRLVSGHTQHAFFLAGAAAAAAAVAARASDGANAPSAGTVVGSEGEGAVAALPPLPPRPEGNAGAGAVGVAASGRGRDSPMTDMDAGGGVDDRGSVASKRAHAAGSRKLTGAKRWWQWVRGCSEEEGLAVE